KLVVTQHAFEEMNDDDLLQVDVEHCILTGEIFERQWDKEWNEWKYIICGESTEDDIMEVVIKVGHLESSIIITTYLV
ncbi:MAG: DUF4258 domain-containing protein, partial [Aridibacter sp.]